jgi:exodeoxyribonuclease V alpha subunit
MPAEPARQRKPLLPAIPRAWPEALERLSLDRALLPLAEGVAGFAAGPDAAAADRDFARQAFLLALLVLASQGAGNTCLPLEAGLDSLAAAFGEDPQALRNALANPRMGPILGGPGGARRPLVLDGGALYSERLHLAECGFAERIKARLAVPERPDEAVAEEILGTPLPLSAEQRAAVRAALRRPLSLITGGPGTGKTAIVVAIIRAALASGTRAEAILLAAPTGKAANRMAQSMGRAPLPETLPAPRTLHRLLGYLPSQERFRHHAENPLAADLVIVDEASMIDMVLMDRLVRAVPPGARLVLLGDEHQLPSVDPGSVFKDLVAGLQGACSRLTESFRMDERDPAGRAILIASRKIGQDPGGLFEAPEPVLVRAGGFRGEKVELADLDEPGMEAFLAQWLDEQIESPGFDERIRHSFSHREAGWAEGDTLRLDALFRHLDRARILCAQKQAPALRGVAGINAHLHGLVQARRDRGLRLALAFTLGEPVLMTRNDYRRGIFNGDQGLVLKVASDGAERLEVVFATQDGYRAFAIGPLLGELELAYATTVHKAQGAEYRTVALVLPVRDNPLLTRELVYTALTRATHSVRIIGSRERFEAAAQAPLARHSGLGRRLAGETP